ncbi:MAG: hypothetical protein OEZ41_04405 [Nitrospirota bacterium]|nr:hypothetical protein [Nitrospirota bacterium]MDH5699186.1 hypothetical protein [Nitrospirota bacterium]
MMTEQMSERMSEKMMKCQRCEGLLVRDSIYNLEGQFHHIEVLRCLNCGETVDATILKAREGENDQRGMREPRFSARHAS